MTPDSENCKPITFQGVEFPRSLMAIDIIEPVLALEDEDFGAWLWKLTICRGVKKSAPASDCERFARQALDLLIENKAALLVGIKKRLGTDGFEPEITFTEWTISMQKIAEISSKTYGDCHWSAPVPDGVDPAKSAKKLMNWAENHRKKMGWD